MRALLPWILAALIGLIAVEAFVIVERWQAKPELLQADPTRLPAEGRPKIDVVQEGSRFRVWLRNASNRPLKYKRCQASSGSWVLEYLEGGKWKDWTFYRSSAEWVVLEPGEMARLQTYWHGEAEWARASIPYVLLGSGGWDESPVHSLKTAPFRPTRAREHYEWSKRGRQWIQDELLVHFVRRIAIGVLPSNGLGVPIPWSLPPVEANALLPHLRITSFDGREMHYELSNHTPFEFMVNSPEVGLGSPTAFERAGRAWEFAHFQEEQCIRHDVPFSPGEVFSDSYHVIPNSPELKLQVLLYRRVPGESRRVWWLTLEAHLGDDLPEWDVRTATDAAYLGWRLVQSRPDYMR